MISRLQKLDSVILHPVKNAVFFRYSARPCAGGFVLQRLWFAQTGEGFTRNGLQQVEYFEEQFPVVLGPISKVVAEHVT